jgi:hypothetical protein
MEQVLQRYALIEHITADGPSDDSGWIQMGNVVLIWINNSISSELHQVVRECGCTARHLWLAIENQFLGNCEQHTLHLDAAFRNFVQGEFSVSEYCRKFKAMADGLADLGSPVEDRILILNILRGLNQRFEHVGSIIRRYSSFLNFLKVRDDLLLEGIHKEIQVLRLPRRRSTPTLRPRQPGRRLARPVAAIVATVATGTRTTTRTATAVMAVATTAGTATAVAAALALLARPPSPLPLMAEPARHGRLTTARGRGT